jgi:hypothetical protein
MMFIVSIRGMKEDAAKDSERVSILESKVQPDLMKQIKMAEYGCVIELTNDSLVTIVNSYQSFGVGEKIHVKGRHSYGCVIELKDFPERIKRVFNEDDPELLKKPIGNFCW